MKPICKLPAESIDETKGYGAAVGSEIGLTVVEIPPSAFKVSLGKDPDVFSVLKELEVSDVGSIGS